MTLPEPPPDPRQPAGPTTRPVLLRPPWKPGQPIMQAELLWRLIDLNRLATPPPAGERTRMFSSYDRRSKIDARGETVDWDANDDFGQFMRRDPDGWDVMAEVEGPGAVTRIWSADPNGQIRIVLDGQPVIETDFDKLLSGGVPPIEEPFLTRGILCYFPIGFAKSCKVVARNCKSYYQINTVQFAAGTQVERFKPELDDDARRALEEVKLTLKDGLPEKQLYAGKRAPPIVNQASLGPDEALEENIEGAGTVRAFAVALSGRTESEEPGALHKCVLRIWFDGEKTPAVEAPLVDFFGCGFDPARFNGLPVGTDKAAPIPLPDVGFNQDRYMYCYFPMPFRNGLRVEIRNSNSSKRKIGLLLDMRVDHDPPAGDALQFHARFRRENPCRTFDYPLLDTGTTGGDDDGAGSARVASGPGRIVGAVLAVDCPRTAWWGEGDDKIWIDGEKFPSYFGTGTEDYFGDAHELHAVCGPFCGATRVASYGKNSAYRWQIADCVDFHKSVRFTLENYAKDMYYGSVVYWYAPPGARDFFPPLKDDDLEVPALRIPGAVEVEGNVLGIVQPGGQLAKTGWGAILNQKGVAGAEFSGEQAAQITTPEPVRILIPASTAQKALLKLRVWPGRTFDTIVVKDAAGKEIGTVKYDPVLSASMAGNGVYPVGVTQLAKGDNAVTVQCTRPAVLDCWVIVAAPAATQPTK